MKKCFIFGNAAIMDYSGIAISPQTLVIAADGGYEHLLKMNITPDILVGDFDSLNRSLPNDCEIIKAPAVKDDTDMMLAVKTALERGYYDITLYGALGGRFDHSAANIQTLEYIVSKGGTARITSADCSLHMLPKGIYKFPQNKRGYFSIFSVSEYAVVSVTGTKYNLEKHKLSRSFPLGVSNEITEPSCTVEIHEGLLLAVLQYM